MRIVNRDLTKETVKVFVTGNQIYAKIWSKNHGKWGTEEYFQSYDWNIDEELISSTIKYIIRVWSLKAPRIVVVH